jgi:molybdate-binding protein
VIPASGRFCCEKILSGRRRNITSEFAGREDFIFVGIERSESDLALGIAANRADIGLGLAAAARQFGLNFHPL